MDSSDEIPDFEEWAKSLGTWPEMIDIFCNIRSLSKALKESFEQGRKYESEQWWREQESASKLKNKNPWKKKNNNGKETSSSKD